MRFLLHFLLSIATAIAAPPPDQSTPESAFAAFDKAHRARDGATVATLLADNDEFKSLVLLALETNDPSKARSSKKLLETKIDGDFAVSLLQITRADGQSVVNDQWFIRIEGKWHLSSLAEGIPPHIKFKLRTWFERRKAEVK